MVCISTPCRSTVTASKALCVLPTRYTPTAGVNISECRILTASFGGKCWIDCLRDSRNRDSVKVSKDYCNILEIGAGKRTSKPYYEKAKLVNIS